MSHHTLVHSDGTVEVHVFEDVEVEPEDQAVSVSDAFDTLYEAFEGDRVLTAFLDALHSHWVEGEHDATGQLPE